MQSIRLDRLPTGLLGEPNAKDCMQIRLMSPYPYSLASNETHKLR